MVGILIQIPYLLVNSHGYYKFQVEIGAVTNRDFNIEIKSSIYGFQPCTTRQLSEVRLLNSKIQYLYLTD